MLQAAFRYFIVVFGVGFALGTARVLLLVPRLGVRTAELLEMPIMVAASFVAARWIIRRFRGLTTLQSLAVGLLSLSFLILAELGMVRLSGSSISTFVATRDPVSGIAYVVALLLFGLMPFFVRSRDVSAIRRW
jgi:hypothetical protein